MTQVSMFKRLRRMLLVAGVVFAALPVGSALANTTIGQTGANEPCAFPGGAVLADPGYVVPAGGGIITSFSFQSTTADTGSRLDFLVLRATTTQLNYTVVGNTGVVVLSGKGAETFLAKPDIPVEAGDILGYWMAGTNLFNCGQDRAGGTVLATDEPLADPKVGATVPLTGEMTTFFDLNESANLVTLLTSKRQCNDGGWKTFGTEFKNQGDCESFAATRGKNPPTGS